MQHFLEQPLANIFKKIKIRDLLILLIIIFAILTRLIGLGNRVMSHDEVNHVVPAFDLFSGRGYRHDPITHGPLQFHLMALSYFLFGDNDFTSRLPHALFSIATIIFVSTYYQRYLGKFGSIAAGAMFAISPFMLFYGRYARNDVICVFLGITAIYAFLRFFETNQNKYLYYFTVFLALNFTAKETAYIFAAQLLVFLLILFIRDIMLVKWPDKKVRNRMLLTNILLIVGICVSIVISVLLFRMAYTGPKASDLSTLTNSQTPFEISQLLSFISPLLTFSVPGLLPLAFGIFLLIFLRSHLGWNFLIVSRAFNLLILIGTLVLPLLAPFLVRFAGMDPSSYSDPYVLMTNYIFIGFFFFLAYFIGSTWNHNHWWKLAIVFYGIYAIFYTTFFTNNTGLMTGMIGSLGHWLNQQSVQRGGQPSYYYAFFLISIYEFLAAFGTILAFYVGIKHRTFWESCALETNPSQPDDTKQSMDQSNSPFAGEDGAVFSDQNLIPNPAIYIFFVITSLVAFTIAGEKMPWLSLHIVFPMLLSTAWVLDYIFRKFETVFNKKETIFHATIVTFLLNTILIIFQLIGNKAPFQGKTQLAFQNTNRFLFLIIIEIGILFFLINFDEKEKAKKIKYSLILGFFLVMSIITTRSSYRAAFINYDNPKEFLVYAHASDGPKRVMEQVEEISRRITTGLDIKVAYDNHGLYPFWWYLRDYPNKIVYLENPTRSLEEAPLIIAGQDKYAKLEPIVKDNYYAFEYMRLWWPMQDYWNLNWERISSALVDPNMRQALFNIWLDRDYSLYAQVNDNQFLTLETWLPSEKMRFYIRKDVVSQMWQYNTQEAIELNFESDPYENKMVSRKPDGFISISGSTPGDLNAPRGIDIASDGTIYVADSKNHRIQQFSKKGLLLNVWGSYANVLEEDAPGGTFNEPWDVAVAMDGSIFVADTFNHRIQKFDPTGRFIKMWGIFAQGDTSESFWGPRGIALDQEGNVYVTDTGNKRVVVFDSNLNFITQFGGGGFEAGQFDEPVGITINSSGQIIVADTWNRRVQIFQPDGSGYGFAPVNSFDVSAWYGQGIDNKPYLTTDVEENIYLSDPEVGRILKFNPSGDFLIGYQDINTSDDLISYPFGMDVDEDGNLWFSDGASNVLSFISQSIQ
ncbi:MAG: TIGR03663 family protein [Pelolinea sp.]|nr:TIGR03663 family protein [Pelolinea sp.]